MVVLGLFCCLFVSCGATEKRNESAGGGSGAALQDLQVNGAGGHRKECNELLGWRREGLHIEEQPFRMLLLVSWSLQ